MSENMTAIVNTESEDKAAINGQIVWITRAITEPEPDVDEETLPLFRAVDQQGNKHTLFPEELRVADDSSTAVQVISPMVHVGNRPVTNLHPLVYRTIRDMATSSEPDLIEGTIYIAPGSSSCRVYAMPYRMRPGQSPCDLLDHHQREWTFIGQLDSSLEIVCLEMVFQHLAADIEGQMGGTHFPAEWQL